MSRSTLVYWKFPTGRCVLRHATLAESAIRLVLAWAGNAKCAAAKRYAECRGLKELLCLSGWNTRPRSAARGWIGVDLDGTLAEYHGWKGVDQIGPPVRAMLLRVKAWVDEGVEVRIFTARVSRWSERRLAIRTIRDWCEQNGLPRLSVTNIKDYQMIELWDDRAVRVVANVGRRADEPTPTHQRRSGGPSPPSPDPDVARLH